MSEPTFWRTELWHPLTVHFPIALLLLATVTRGIGLWAKGDTGIFYQKVGSLLLVIGVAFGWVAIYTGDLAEATVARKICDPPLLKQHEGASYTMAWLFSGALLGHLLSFLPHPKSRRFLLSVLTFLVMLAGSGYLVYTSHLGAKVVYEQGGGYIQKPSDCQ